MPKPKLKAAGVSLLYISFCLLYIWVSGKIASSLTSGKDELAQLEAIKGTVFVLVTGVFFFFVTFCLLKNIALAHERLRKQEQDILRQERKEIAATCMASVCHDLNNVLQVIYALLDEIEDSQEITPDLESLRDHLIAGVDDLKAMSTRIQQSVSDKQHQRKETVNLAEYADVSCRLVNKHPAVISVDIDNKIDKDISVSVNAELLSSMLLNLLINAAQAINGKGNIQIRCTCQHDLCRIEVHDDGPGVPDELRQKILDPLFTTKPNGSGLGLLSLRAFSLGHQGEIFVTDSDLGGGCIGCEFNMKPDREEPDEGL